MQFNLRKLIKPNDFNLDLNHLNFSIHHIIYKNKEVKHIEIDLWINLFILFF